MSASGASPDETGRLSALRRCAILDTAPEESFDRIVRLAKSFFDVPIALITFVDENRQWFKARIGLDIQETPRLVAFCNVAIEGKGVCEVSDATRDPRFAANPLVNEDPGIRFYAGAPLVSPDGYALGTICVIDTRARDELSAAQCDMLTDLAATVMSELERRNLALNFSTTVESIEDGLYTLDRDWRFHYINRRAEAFLRRSGASLLGKSLWTEFPYLLDAEPCRQFHHAVETREVARFEFYSPPLERWLDISAHPSEFGLTIHLRDASHRREREKRQYLLETAISHLHDTVLISEFPAGGDADPAIVFVNEAFETASGHQARDVIGRSPRMLENSTSQPGIDDILAELRAGRSVKSEQASGAGSRRNIWMELDFLPIMTPGGACSHAVVVGRDISGRRAAEKHLRASEERFRILARASFDAIWDWNIIDDTIWWSDGLTRTFGHDVSKSGSRAAAWTRRIDPADRERVIKGLKSVVEGVADEWTDEYRFLRADGTYAQVVDRGTVIRDGNYRAFRMVGALSDVTIQRELAEQLRQAQRLEAIGQLTGGVAHDFNNLLMVIIGAAERLAEALSGDRELGGLAEMALSAGERGAALTRQLLAFARQQDLSPTLIDVGALLTGLTGLLRQALGEHIDIRIHAPAGLWRASLDGPQLENAILNLAINARDAMPGGGSLSIEATNLRIDAEEGVAMGDQPAGRYIMIAVSDTGAGMTGEVSSRAFDPFFTTKGAGKGTGLGLSQVFGFAKQSRGHARIETEPGRGTTVRLYFPETIEARANAA